MAQTPTITPRQARFVQEYLIDGCGAQAAIRSGIAPSGAHVWASRALRITKVAEALQAQQSADAARLSLRREDVLAGLLEAVDTARQQQNPTAMVSGLRELGRMLGFYVPEVKRVKVAVEEQGGLSHLSRMTDAQLLAVIATGNG